MKSLIGLLTIIFAWTCILLIISLPLQISLNWFLLYYSLEIHYVQVLAGLISLFFIKIALNPMSLVSDLAITGLDKYIEKTKTDTKTSIKR